MVGATLAEAILVGAILFGVILVGTTLAEEIEEAILEEVIPEEVTTGNQTFSPFHHGPRATQARGHFLLLFFSSISYKIGERRD